MRRRGSRCSPHELECDEAGCESVFRSYSVLAVVREQAAAVGWERKRVKRDGRSVTIDSCPRHRVAGVENPPAWSQFSSEVSHGA